MLKGSRCDEEAKGWGLVAKGSAGWLGIGAPAGPVLKGSAARFDAAPLLPGPSSRDAQSFDCSFETGCAAFCSLGGPPKAPHDDTSCIFVTAHFQRKAHVTWDNLLVLSFDGCHSICVEAALPSLKCSFQAGA